MARLSAFAERVPAGQSVFAYLDAATLIGASAALFAGVFALRVALRGNAAFAVPAPRRMRGKRAVHGDADWMKMQEAGKLFPDAGGIVIGERYRVDRDSVAASAFRPQVARHGEPVDDPRCSASTASFGPRTASSLPARAASRRHR
jgi:type IV secretion system protein VirD4